MHSFTVSIEQKIKKLIKLKKLQRIYYVDHNLLIPWDLSQTHDQILPIIFLKDFINLNVNNKHEQENRTCKIKQKYYDTFLEYTNFEDDLTEFKCLSWYKKLSTEVSWKVKGKIF